MKVYLRIILISASGLLIIANANLCKRDSKKPATGKSIAVLPFRILNEDSTAYPFIEGFRESLLNELVNSGRYRVISRVSSGQYSEPGKTTPQIGKDLQSDYIIQGSFEMDQTTMELRVQTIRTIDGQNIWSKNFTGKLINIFDLQLSISREIARSVNLVITDDRRPAAGERRRQTADSVPPADKNYRD